MMTERETEYLCPKCGDKLYRKESVNDGTSSMVGGAMKNALSVMAASLFCKKCGTIPAEQLSQEDQEKLRKDKSSSLGCFVVGIIICVVAFIIFAAISSSMR